MNMEDLKNLGKTQQVSKNDTFWKKVVIYHCVIMGLSVVLPVVLVVLLILFI